MEMVMDMMRQKPMDEITDEDDLLTAFKRAIGVATEAQAGEVAEYDRNWKYYMGQHYLRKLGGRWMADTSGGDKLRLQRDVIQVAIDALRPILVKMRPHIMVLASYPSEDAKIEGKNGQSYAVEGLKNSDVASFLSDVLRKEHKRRHEDILLAEMTLEVMVTGQAFRVMLPVWRDGLGWVMEPKLYPQNRVFKDPRGTRLETFRDFKSLIFRDEMDAGEIEHWFGVKESEYTKENIRSDTAMMSERRDEGRSYFRGRSQFSRYGDRGTTDSLGDSRTYNIDTGYFNDAGGGGMTSTGDRRERKALRFPFGRQLIMINEQKIIVDQPNPFWHGDYPATCYQSQPIPHMARALNDVGKLKDVQRGVNLLMNALIGTTLLGQNPKLLYEDGAFNPNDWQGGPGGMVRVNRGAIQGDQLMWFQPNTADRGSYNLMKDLEYYGLENVAGVTSALQGQELAAGSSGKYANTLQGAAMTAPMFRIEMLDSGHYRNASQEIELVQQFADFGSPYFTDMVDMEKYHPMIGEAVRDLYYRTEYESQAELPHNPIARQNYYFNLFDQGVYDFEEYIDRAHIPMRPELRELARKGSLENFMPGVPRQVRVELMMQMMAAQQQAQQAEGQQQALAGSGGPQELAGGSEGGLGGGEGGDIMGDPDQRSL